MKNQRDKLKTKFPDTERALVNWGQNEERRGVSQGLPTSGDWESHRHTIIQLYMREGRTLNEVMQIMRTQHSFDATVKMYVSRFVLWDVEKNNPARRMMTLKQGPFEEPPHLPGNWPSNEIPPSSTFAFSDSLETGTMPSPQPYHDGPGIGDEYDDGALPGTWVSGQSPPDHPRSPSPRTVYGASELLYPHELREADERSEHYFDNYMHKDRVEDLRERDLEQRASRHEVSMSDVQRLQPMDRDPFADPDGYVAFPDGDSDRDLDLVSSVDPGYVDSREEEEGLRESSPKHNYPSHEQMVKEQVEEQKLRQRHYDMLQRR